MDLLLFNIEKSILCLDGLTTGDNLPIDFPGFTGLGLNSMHLFAINSQSQMELTTQTVVFFPTEEQQWSLLWKDGEFHGCDIQRPSTQLTPYPLQRDAQMRWSRLSCHVKLQHLKKLLPAFQQGFKISAMDTCSYISNIDKRIDQGNSADESFVSFTNINLKFPFPPGISAQEKTKYCLDSSLYLVFLFPEFSDFLAELQLAFVLFICGHWYDGLEQWKRLVALALQSGPRLGSEKMDSFLDVLQAQLGEFPVDLFSDAILQDNFLDQKLNEFALLTREEGEETSKSAQFLRFLRREFKWEPSVEVIEDEEPVVVEM